MFEQYISDGANLFIAITVIVLGFAAGLSYIDYLKTQKENKNNQPPL